MVDSEVRQRSDRQHYLRGPAFEVLAAKLRRPLIRAGTVRRSLLIERLARGDRRPVVSVVAPPGYGKTTLLAQWAERNGQAFAWVSVDETDNDPKVLLSYIAQALNAVEPIDGRVFDALASPASSVPGTVVPRLGSAFLSMTSPVALVLDDVHALRNAECQAAVSALADHVPGGSRLALAGRDQPPVRVARLRAEGKLLEIGPADLSLSREEASSLLHNADLSLAEADMAALHRRTEGWPVGLYLAALYLREGGSLERAAVSFGGDDRFVSEYLESEFLARISQKQREFLTRTAVLERMSAPLCDAVLERDESARVLDGLARSNLLLVPLDRRGQWYRYHRMFRDMLLAELERQEPGLIPGLRHRAALWCQRNGLPEQALSYAIAAGDVDTAAGLVGSLGITAYRQGRVTTLQQWLRWLQRRGAAEQHPMVAVLGTVLATVTGQPVEAERWADAFERWQDQQADEPADAFTAAWATAFRAVMCRHGIEQMRADADQASQRFTPQGPIPPVVSLMQGLARFLGGDLDGADAFFQDALGVREITGAPEVLAVALCEQALVAIARGAWDHAGTLASQSAALLSQAGIEESFATPLICAVQARAAMHRGDIAAAKRELIRAQRLRHLLTYALPHLAVQARIELAHVHLTVGDFAGARTLMQEIDQLLRQRPDLGILVSQAQALRAQLSSHNSPASLGPSTLTAAELRLLPLLTTHLTMAQISADLYLSVHTVKTQGKSIYRKLGASTRSQAVAQARELGLLEG